MDLSAAGAAVSVVEAETLPKVAEMFEDCPAVPAVASPAALIEAAVVFEEAHVTVAVMSLVLASE
jgi:hypothetical protein